MPKPENILGQGFHTNPERINRHGANKGSKWLKTRLRELLESDELSDRVLKALITKAEKGDVNAIKEIFDRVDGKVTQEIDQKTTIEDIRIDASKLTDEELRVLAEIQRKSGVSKEES